jgi:hypothetical protein
MVVEGLADLLELENDPAFLDLKCPTTGVLAWPALRNDVFRLLLSDRLYPTAPIVSLERTAPIGRVLANAARAATYGATHRPEPSEILIIGSGAGLLPRDGMLFNRLTDSFAMALGERAWTLEGLFGDRWPAASRANRRLGFLGVDRARIAIEMRRPISRSTRELADRLVALVVARASETLGWVVDIRRQAWLRTSAARRLAAYPLRARLAKRLLDRSGARLVLLEDACFGPHAVFNSIARERGVEVAEFQHGMITRNHDAYNVHDMIGGSEAYARTLPQTMLTYGAWWNDELNMPVKRIAIGNPYRSDVLATWRPAAIRDRILVLGDGVETDLFLGLCRKLAAIAPPPLRVVFRPHPQEKARTGLLTGEPFTIDNEPDLYHSLAASTVLIGESSTGLYEAVGLGIRIFVWDTAKSRFYLGNHPFARFTTPDELAGKLANQEGEVDPQVAGSLWAMNWRDQFFGYVGRR